MDDVVYHAADLEIRPAEHLVLARGRALTLSVRELDVLAALAERGEVKAESVQEAYDRYRIGDPTAVRGVLQEGGDA